MTRKLARTNAEAHLYMSRSPCPACGQTGFASRPRSAVMNVDGELASRYEAACAGCGAARQFEFRLPAQILAPPAYGVSFGGEDPSELLDPGEWMIVADEHAQRVPAHGAGGGDPEQTIAVAVAAIDEILKFIPPGAEACPPEAFTTERGRAMRAAEPGRFRAARLRAVRGAYAALAQRN